MAAGQVAEVSNRGHQRAVRPLKARVAYAALALLVAAVTALGTWAIVSARDSQRSRILVSETSAARLAASALSSALGSDLSLLTNLAAQPGLAQIFQRPPDARLASIGATLHVLYPGFAGFGIVSATGRLDSVWPAGSGTVGADVSSAPYFRAVMRSGRSYVSGPVPAPPAARPGARFEVTLATPVRDRTGKLLGLLDASLSPTEISGVLGGVSFGENGELVIVSQDGRALTGPAAGSPASFRAQPFAAAGLSGSTGSGTGAVPGFSDTRLVGYAPVSRTGWAVLAEEPLSDLESPMAGLTNRLVAIGVLVLLVAAGTAALVVQLVRRLTREREHAGAVLRSVGEGVATVDTDGLLVEANPALEALVGRAARECAGMRCSDALPLHDQRGQPVSWEQSLIAEALRERKVLRTTGYHYYLGTADGRRVPISLTAGPIVTAGVLEGAVVVVRDVSHEREVDQLKTSLVSTVSHELRTPLTMIQGFSELMLTAGLDELQQQEALAQIHSSSRRLGRLIDDLLSVSRIESGRLSAELEPVAIGDLVTEVVASFPEASAGRLAIDVESSMPDVLADRDKTVQVLTNLISNALKYSGAGSPVRVTARAAGDHAEVSVADEGIGMSDEELEVVFEKFIRADHPAVRKVSGTGLGLYITKSLVELQQGQLWVESRPGEGSTFTFSAPWAEAGSEVALAHGSRGVA